MKQTLTFDGYDGVVVKAAGYGDPDRPPVLLLHGGGQTKRAWRDTAKALDRAGFYAIALDARGHGESGWSEDGVYVLERFKCDLDAVIGQLERPPALVGASLGGVTALLSVGEALQSRVWALVMVDISTSVQAEGVERIIAFMQSRPDGFANMDEVADAVAGYLPHRKRPTNLEGLRHNVRVREDGRLVWHWDPRFLKQRPAEAARQWEIDTRSRLEDSARRLALPALIVRGMRSDVVTTQDVEAFLALAPHAEYVDVKRAGHMVAGDNNDVFTASILDFLGRSLVSAG